MGRLSPVVAEEGAVARLYRCGADNPAPTVDTPGNEIFGDYVLALANVTTGFPDYTMGMPNNGSLTGLMFSASVDAETYVLGSIARGGEGLGAKGAQFVSDTTDFSGVQSGNQVRTPKINSESTSFIYPDAGAAMSDAEAAVTSLTSGFTIYGSIIRILTDGPGLFAFEVAVAYGNP